MCFLFCNRNQFFSRQRIVVDKYMERNNLLIGHKHDKKISVIESQLDTNMTRKYPSLKDKRYIVNELSYVCGYTRTLDLTSVRKVLFLEACNTVNLT
jgi:hypothetical protein